MTDRPLVSLIIPSKNEAEDIAATLDSCLAMRYEPKEILVVDDSSDSTPEIVSRYSDRGVRLVHRETNSNACCGARNLGMKMAKGEILFLMNGDVRPLPDFVDRVLAHYRAGADFVLVNSRVMNPENPWASFVHAERLSMPDSTLEWTEGFSCRKSAAKAVGYIPGDFPIGFCRDYLFGRVLAGAGFKKLYDPSIPMDNVAPRSCREFWGQRVWRGSFSPLQRYYLMGHSLPGVVLIEIARAARTIGLDLLIVPAVARAWRLARRVGPVSRNLGGFFRAGLVHDAGSLLGASRGLRRLLKTEGWWGRYPGGALDVGALR